jgi:hypothetical protein
VRHDGVKRMMLGFVDDGNRLLGEDVVPGHTHFLCPTLGMGDKR